METIQGLVNTQRVIFLGLLLLGLLLSVIYFLLRGHILKTNKANRDKIDSNSKQKRALLLKSLEVQERERQRIAIEIHDSLISELNVFRYIVPEQEKRIQSLMISARNISHDLSPPLIEKVALWVLFRDHIDPLKNQFEVLETYRDYAGVCYESKLQLYRIFQELINNIIQHSKASKIVINFRSSKRWLYLSIEDNGIGMEMNNTVGLGLKNIEIRNEVLQGNYDFSNSGLNNGVKFRIIIENL